MTNRRKKLRRERLIYFFLSLGLALFTLAGLTPSLRSQIQGIGALFTWKSPPADYRLEQLEMERARLKAELELAGLPKPSTESRLAHVIGRDPLSVHILWIDLGNKNCPFIEKFSPVCVGPHAVGIVEEVGRYRSKVRLLSDPKVGAHVCAGKAETLAHHYISELTAMTHDSVVQSALELIGKKLVGEDGDGRLKERLATAQISGFDRNSCFAGEVIQGAFSPGDLIVTSGYDGIFPAGLFVGRITKSHHPSQKIEAKPCHPFHSLRAVFVLPAQNGI